MPCFTAMSMRVGAPLCAGAAGAAACTGSGAVGLPSSAACNRLSPFSPPRRRRRLTSCWRRYKTKLKKRRPLTAKAATSGPATEPDPPGPAGVGASVGASVGAGVGAGVGGMQTRAKQVCPPAQSESLPAGHGFTERESSPWHERFAPSKVMPQKQVFWLWTMQLGAGAGVGVGVGLGVGSVPVHEQQIGGQNGSAQLQLWLHQSSLPLGH